MSLLPVLATAVMLACGEDHAESERLPRVDSAVSVPLSYFASVDTSGMFAGLACTKLDPTGRSVRGNPVVIRVDPGGIYLGEELVVALVDGVVPEESVTGSSISPLYKRMLNLADSQVELIETLGCVGPFRGSVLLDIDKQLPVELLTRVANTVANARYEDTWIKVTASTKLEPESTAAIERIERIEADSGLAVCMQLWGIHWTEDSIATTRGREREPMVLKPRSGSPDADALLDVMEEPAWLALHVVAMPDDYGSIESVVGLFSAFSARYGDRGDIALHGAPVWPHKVQATEGGPVVPAVRVSIGQMHGKCRPEYTAQTQCIGLDNIVREREGLHCYD